MTKLPQRLFHIMESHARIDAALRRAEAHAHPDNARVSQLRLMKLRAAALLRNALARRSGVVA